MGGRSTATASSAGMVAAFGGGNGQRAHNGGNSHGRPSHSGHKASHSQGPRQEATGGEPSGIENVTFLRRQNEPRRNAGHRAR